MKYSPGHKEAVVAMRSPPQNRPVREVAAEVSISSAPVSETSRVHY